MSRLDTLERNYLINGGFDLFQRSVSAVNLTTTMSYANADRFRQAYSGTVTGTPTTIRSVDVPANGKSKYSLSIGCQRNSSSVILSVAQRVESLNSMELSGEVISLSMMYKFPVATQVELKINTPSLSDNYTSFSQVHSSTQVVVADNTWRQVKFEAIQLPTVSNGFEIIFNIILPSGTDGSVVNHLISQIKLNSGYKSTNFSRCGRNFEEEKAICERYCESGTYGGGSMNGLGNIYAKFRVEKRAIPVVTALNTGYYVYGGSSATMSFPSVSPFNTNIYEWGLRGHYQSLQLSMWEQGLIIDAEI